MVRQHHLLCWTELRDGEDGHVGQMRVVGGRRRLEVFEVRVEMLYRRAGRDVLRSKVVWGSGPVGLCGSRSSSSSGSSFLGLFRWRWSAVCW